MHRRIAWGLSFAIGLSVMVLELTASRLMAPIVGSSLYTWTAIIGVVLAGLSLGAYHGGRIIDRAPSTVTLRTALVVSGGTVLLSLFMVPVATLVALLPLPTIASVLLVASITFFPPALVLGALQPMVVRLCTEDVEHLGRSYGSLSSVWSLGSIVGVFASGFVLIPLLGSWKTMVAVSLALFLCAALLMRRAPLVAVAVAVCVLVSVSDPPIGKSVLYASDTPYFHALVADADIASLGPSRILFLDIDTHSIRREAPSTPIYTDISRLFSSGLASTSRTLVIGGGAYTMPNDLARLSSSSVDVYELDPAVPPIVAKYFGIDPRVVTSFGDARMTLADDATSYDLIIGDSFNSYISVPWHLMTREFNESIARHLRSGGVYAINVISTVEGSGNGIYAAVDRTLRETFAHVEAYRFGESPTAIQNVVFLASNAPLDAWIERGRKTNVLLGSAQTFEMLRISGRPDGGPILSDDRAPTDLLLLPIAAAALPFSIKLYRSVVQ